MKLFDNDNMHWRMRAFERILKRNIWSLKFLLDFSAKEKVDKISIVVVGRNDNYGGDFTDRLRTTIDWNYNHFPNPELIYVEWNPLEDRPSDTEWISKRYPNSKCFIVSREIHQALSVNPKIPMMEYFAKNLGIREASNDWIALINADVFLGHNTLKNIHKLNKKFMYGSHYKNIIWDKQPITDQHITDKSIVKNLFSSGKIMRAVVGNFILTHKDNWYKSRGYDETLMDIRSGVDKNGLEQLLYHGVKPMVIGDHYHLDHNESLIKGGNQTHGNESRIANGENIPYRNPDDWGLQSYKRVQIAPNIWKLEL